MGLAKTHAEDFIEFWNTEHGRIEHVVLEWQLITPEPNDYPSSELRSGLVEPDPNYLEAIYFLDEWNYFSFKLYERKLQREHELVGEVTK